jgi:hypothetical protein
MNFEQPKQEGDTMTIADTLFNACHEVQEYLDSDQPGLNLAQDPFLRAEVEKWLDDTKRLKKGLDGHSWECIKAYFDKHSEGG